MFIDPGPNQMIINLLLKIAKNLCLQIVQNNGPFYPFCLKQSIHIPIEDSPTTIEKDWSAGKKLPIFGDAVISAQSNARSITVPGLGLCIAAQFFHLPPERWSRYGHS